MTTPRDDATVKTAEVEKQTYKKPAIVRLGSVRDVTLTGARTNAGDLATGKMN